MNKISFFSASLLIDGIPFKSSEIQMCALLLFFASLSEIPTSESKNKESISFCITYFMTRCPMYSCESLLFLPSSLSF